MMTKSQIQRVANTENRATWYASGNGGGWWIQPDPKVVARNKARRDRDQMMRWSPEIRDWLREKQS